MGKAAGTGHPRASQEPAAVETYVYFLAFLSCPCAWSWGGLAQGARMQAEATRPSSVLTFSQGLDLHLLCPLGPVGDL